MQLTILLPALGLALSTLAGAQSVIDYTKLPACAQQCNILAQAQANCVPPAAPVTTQDIYQSCFCQSALLTTLKTSPALCQTACSADDATKIEQYYIALCNGPTVQPPETTTTTTTTATATTSDTSTATGTAAGGKTKGVSENKSTNGGWFSTHWKWVLMLIIIFLFMIVASVLGVWLKRRHARRADARRANMAAADAPVADAAFHEAVAKEMSGGLPAPPPVRTRASTIASRGSSRLSRQPEPVVWGPHQHASTWAESNTQDFARQPRVFGRHEQHGEPAASNLKEVRL